MLHYANGMMSPYVYVCRQICLAYVCVYVGINAYMHLHSWECKYIFMQAGMHACMYACSLYVYMHVGMYAGRETFSSLCILYMYASISICIYVERHILLCIYVFLHVCVCMYACRHTEMMLYMYDMYVFM